MSDVYFNSPESLIVNITIPDGVLPSLSLLEKIAAQTLTYIKAQNMLTLNKMRSIVI